MENEVKVILQDRFKNYSSDHERLHGKPLVVREVKMVRLGETSMQVVYFKPLEGVQFTNPFLVKHFQQYNED